MKCSIKNLDFINLGLSKPTLWATTNLETPEGEEFFHWEEVWDEFYDSIPSPEDWELLIKECSWEWSQDKKGYKVTGPNGNSIFLPAKGYKYTGYCTETKHMFQEEVFYWANKKYDNNAVSYFKASKEEKPSIEACPNYYVKPVRLVIKN